MKCKCGKACLYFPKLEGWLCTECDIKDILEGAREAAQKVIQDLEEHENEIRN